MHRQGALPSSYVFKAFNTIGLEHMAALGPQGAAVFGGEAAAIERGPITMLYAGAEEKRAVAAAIISDVVSGTLRVPHRLSRLARRTNTACVRCTSHTVVFKRTSSLAAPGGRAAS
jgi:hypothetical protein